MRKFCRTCFNSSWRPRTVLLEAARLHKITHIGSGQGHGTCTGTVHSFFFRISESLVKLGEKSLVKSLVKLVNKKQGCRKSVVVDEIYNNSLPKYTFVLTVKPRSGKIWKSNTLKSNFLWFWRSILFLKDDASQFSSEMVLNSHNFLLQPCFFIH